MVEKLKVLKSLNIEANELLPVILLITQSVFLGIFYGAFDIGAHTLFLKTYPDDMIPKAYIISGFLGIILTAFYSKLQSKIKFSKLATGTLLAISVITVVMRLFFEFTMAPWTIFLVFIMLGPLNILAILSFWGTVGRIFNLRQGKRLFGIIDSGQVFGIIISSYTIPVILVYLNGTKNLLLISAISIILAMLIELIIARKIKIDVLTSENEVTPHETEEQLEIKQFAKDPYVLYMSLFVIFSMFAAFFVQYSFLVVTNEQYPNEDDLAKYLGFFTGSMMIFTFLIKTFVFSKLMKTYGLKISLLLSPILLALFTGIAILVGYTLGFEKATPGFIYFFLFISMGKLFNKTLKDALEGPSFKLLYQSLRKAIRFDIQAKIDGTINEIAALTSGLLLGGLGILAFIELIHFSVFLFALLILWTIIAFRLYKEYRLSLEKALIQESPDKLLETETNKFDGFDQFITEPLKFNTKLSLIKNYSPLRYKTTLQNITHQFKPEEIPFLDIDPLIDLLILESVGQNPKNWSDYLNQKYPVDKLDNPNSKVLAELLHSKNLANINTAINFLYKLNSTERQPFLNALLRAPNLQVQKTAICLCGRWNETEFLNTLTEFLESKYLLPYSLASLANFKPEVVKQLIQFFYKTDIKLISQIALVELIGKYNTTESIIFLLDNISHFKKEIKEKAVECLLQLKYKPAVHELPKMFHPITESSQAIAWDIAAIGSLATKYEDHPLKLALEFELAHHKKLLFKLLSITYDAKSVKHVQDYLESGTAEGNSYALELFDLFISDEIKPMVLAVFEDLPPIEKTRAFEPFFPVEITTTQNLLINIINRDANLICNETKKIALLEFTQLFKQPTDDLVAQLFNPVLELQTIAAYTVNVMQPDIIKQIRPRLTPALNKNLTKTLSNTPKFDSVFNYHEPISKYFNCPLEEIIGISEFIEIDSDTKGLFFENNNQLSNYFVFLIWNQNEMPANPSIVFYTDLVKDRYEIAEDTLLLGLKNEVMNKFLLTQPNLTKALINTYK